MSETAKDRLNTKKALRLISISNLKIYAILIQREGVFFPAFNLQFLICCSAWSQLGVYIFVCSVSLEIWHSNTFQRHLRITQFWTDLRNSLLCGDEIQPAFFFFHSCSVFQAVVASRLSAYRKSWGKAKFIRSISLLKEMQEVSWSVKAGCLLRNTNCLVLTNYKLYCFTTKLGPRKKKKGILKTSH